MAIGDIRKTVTVTTAEDIDFNADGGSVLVELTQSTNSNVGEVDFQTTPDGVTFYNVPYIDRTALYPTPSVDSIVPTTTAKLYLILGPLSQVRISCGTQIGTLTVVYRTIQAVYPPMQHFVTPDGDSLIDDSYDAVVVHPAESAAIDTINDLNTTMFALLLELRRLARIGELTLGAEVKR